VNFDTEWGVAWSTAEANGPNPVETKAKAKTMVKNMRAYGLEARVVWRGITPWMEEAEAE
jgi:hypothetical protein